MDGQPYQHYLVIDGGYTNNTHLLDGIYHTLTKQGGRADETTVHDRICDEGEFSIEFPGSLETVIRLVQKAGFLSDRISIVDQDNITRRSA